MTTTSPRFVLCAGLAAAALAVGLTAQDRSAPEEPPAGFRFKSGVELVNVTATVTDDRGRFVGGLTQRDFSVLDDGVPQTISHFSNERVPVSLGIAIDTSGSMTPEKMASARGAIERLIDTLLDTDDEMFLYRFSSGTELVQPWTSDRLVMRRALNGLYPGGGTALYDAVADAVPVAQSGRNTKKALVVISDGNDTGSFTTTSQLRKVLRESEVIVYAIGVDGELRGGFPGRRPGPSRPWPPFPRPGRGLPPIIIGGGQGGGIWSRGGDEHVNNAALRAITDDTGGRTEIVKDFDDLPGATTRIADELTRQYYLGYVSPGHKDGKWHEIRVDVREGGLRVRARRGYIAS